jgi:glycosyltransferase involved in cell wall biosynthesis
MNGAIMNGSCLQYALITAARNEEKLIGSCIESILQQELRPVSWVIVSDNSIDDTEKIVENYCRRFNFIKLIQKKTDVNHKGFASKVQALNLGFQAIKKQQFSFLGHLDADITLDRDYYSTLIRRCLNNPKIGIIGGYVYEMSKGLFKSRATNSTSSVAGGIQLFRNECYLEICPINPVSTGGEDWLAEIMARKNGWQVIAFPDVMAYHHKPSITKRGVVPEGIRMGRMDWAFGSHPIFEVFKCARRIKVKPYFIFAGFVFIGFFSSYLTLRNREIGQEIVNYLRREQLNRLLSFLK